MPQPEVCMGAQKWCFAVRNMITRTCVSICTEFHALLIPDCDFVGSSKELSLGHFSTKHSGSAKSFCYNCSIPISLELQQKSVILQEEQEGTIFILNNGVQNLGNVINVCCIAPISSKRGFSYDLLATNGGRSVKLQSSAEHVWGWVEHTTPKSFLMVPSDFFGSRGQLNLELHISWSPGVSSRLKR